MCWCYPFVIHNSLLHRAVSRKDLVTAAFLIRLGADPLITNSQLHTPVQQLSIGCFPYTPPITRIEEKGSHFYTDRASLFFTCYLCWLFLPVLLLSFLFYLYSLSPIYSSLSFPSLLLFLIFIYLLSSSLTSPYLLPFSPPSSLHFLLSSLPFSPLPSLLNSTPLTSIPPHFHPSSFPSLFTSFPHFLPSPLPSTPISINPHFLSSSLPSLLNSFPPHFLPSSL